MAHHILGVDLGAYSVKVMVVQPGLRSSTAVDYVERPVPSGDEPHEIRAARALGQILRQKKLETDGLYAAAAGDKLFIHVLEFPFRNVKRMILENAVGGELENVLPIDLEDMVFSFETLPHDLARPAPDSNPMAPAEPPPGAMVGDDEATNVQKRPRPDVVHGRVAEPTPGMRVLSCAMELERASSILSTLGREAAEPRSLVAAPASYARIAERMTRLSQSSGLMATGGRGTGMAPPVAIIDLGHERTDVCIVRSGRVVYARSIARGGRHLTEMLSRAWGVSLAECEQAKHQHGFIASAALSPPTREQARVHDVVVKELVPLARDLKRTLASCLAKTGAAVSEAVLVGGGSRLRGLAPFLSEKLRIPVSTLDQTDASDILGVKLASMGVAADIACLAAGIAYEGGAGRPRFDLRQGALAYKADLSFLRQKASFLAALAIVIIGFAVANGFAAHYKLRQSHAALSQRLAVETMDAFGESMSAKRTLLETQGVTGEEAKDSPLPGMTAYDILLAINKQLPKRDKITLDVRELDIKSGKVTMKASAKSSGEIDQLEEQLAKIDCFKVSRGATSTGANDMQEFSFNITSTCMEPK